jgi:hypothetical protein
MSLLARDAWFETPTTRRSRVRASCHYMSASMTQNATVLSPTRQATGHCDSAPTDAGVRRSGSMRVCDVAHGPRRQSSLSFMTSIPLVGDRHVRAVVEARRHNSLACTLSGTCRLLLFSFSQSCRCLTDMLSYRIRDYTYSHPDVRDAAYCLSESRCRWAKLVAQVYTSRVCGQSAHDGNQRDSAYRSVARTLLHVEALLRGIEAN